MIAHFFIHRPIFAWVISIVIMLAGIGSIFSLPVAQYPDIAPPTIRINTTYTGASAQTVENSVIQIIEQQLTGLDGLLYFSSTSSSSGSASIDVTFQKGTDADTAQVQVQNKVAQITTRLPKSVQNEGVRVTKAQNDFLMIVSLYDVTDTKMSVDVADYLLSNLQDPIARLEGVGTVQVFGGQYAMRIWLDPSKLVSYNLMPSDISSAITAQNVQVSAGSIGALPTSSDQQLNATVTAKSQLQTPLEFEQIIVKSDSSGAIVRLSDVARVELGSESYSNVTRLNGHPASGLAVMLAPGANALSTANRIKAAIAKMEPTFPSGYKVAYPRDSTKFIRISIEEVVKTLFEAILLVLVVMFVFLQNWRATLIPAIAVPVVLLGTFGVLEVFGYSINTLTMFGMVLSIGLLVDDAIVVVENVERIMREEKLPPVEATEKSMKEITSALVGIATVLSAVFLPMAFFAGSTGVIYRQFSITIVSSMILSVIVALTLTPALCASLLKPHEEILSHGFFGWFNKTFDSLTARYKGRVGLVIATPFRWMLVYAIIASIMAFLMLRLPTGFLPSEDQGDSMVQFTLPAGASFKRSNAVSREIEHYFLNEESNNTEAIFTISGFSFSGSGQNAGMAFVALKDWDERPGVENRSDIISNRATMKLSRVRDAQIFSLNPPAIQGLGQSNGFNFQLQALADTDREQLKTLRDSLLGSVRSDSTFMAVRLGSMEDTPQLHVNIDEAKAVALGLSLSDVDDTLNYAWAGVYVNDFVDRGRIKKVYVQGDAPFRSKPEDLDQWYVKSNTDVMTPFASFATTSWSYGAQSLTRYNGLASYEIQGSAASGISSGVAMDKIEALQEALPSGTSFAWSGLSYQERLSSGQTLKLYAISILVVFLCLAALYESWAVPFSVLLVIPLGVFGSVVAASLRGLENDVYFQVALLTTIGLSSKNAILIVEFVEAAYNRGSTLVDAAIEGAKLRLRPILMTSLAFIAGVLPLALSSGAGANSRISIGTGIVGGTLSATFLAIFLVPLFFVLVRGIFPKRKRHATMVGEV
ncbi:efflux RND transporter permease subunit [Sulfurospirillum halorespirans]|uniref:Multidrug efflux pump, inner membrane transporter EefB n=1 Tax=Sulfurospirillum halorespirans DSM 13726 TaxID=1193502 RepID=A0A1D7TM77_9BACT|nr:efflux RND transporter permease subunit [Sulfurospirillum halorespirans]AOO66096.1 multidrug efflux pump, inner membrane transporter EefB [Sulfurospirillum halorespirans DSM 13726]